MNNFIIRFIVGLVTLAIIYSFVLEPAMRTNSNSRNEGILNETREAINALKNLNDNSYNLH